MDRGFRARRSRRRPPPLSYGLTGANCGSYGAGGSSNASSPSHACLLGEGARSLDKQAWLGLVVLPRHVHGAFAVIQDRLPAAPDHTGPNIVATRSVRTLQEDFSGTGDDDDERCGSSRREILLELTPRLRKLRRPETRLRMHELVTEREQGSDIGHRRVVSVKKRLPQRELRPEYVLVDRTHAVDRLVVAAVEEDRQKLVHVRLRCER